MLLPHDLYSIPIVLGPQGKLRSLTPTSCHVNRRKQNEKVHAEICNEKMEKNMTFLADTHPLPLLCGKTFFPPLAYVDRKTFQQPDLFSMVHERSLEKFPYTPLQLL